MGKELVTHRYVALRAYCRESGLSLRHLQHAIFTAEESGIIDADAVLKCGGRWYVVPEMLHIWLKGRTTLWFMRRKKKIV